MLAVVKTHMSARILLVDDHPMIPSGLRQELVKRPNLEVVGQATGGEEAVRLAARLAPDLVVMDVHMPHADGLVATRQILHVSSGVKVIFYADDPDRLQVDEAFRAGACGYVLKSNPVEELIGAIETILQGRMYVSADLTANILEGYRESLINGRTAEELAISGKEQQLLRLLAAGMRSKEMAARLHLSPSSVETYRMRIKKKLGLQSTAELVRYAIDNRIASL